MQSEMLALTVEARAQCADRIGMAKLAKAAFDGRDLKPLWAS